jgi:alpha-D-ribose 1-methylphosphonate 5-triphosphate synthase subunit PhnH
MGSANNHGVARINGSLSTEVLPGFVNPILDSQAAFRSIMDAAASPGTLVEVGRSLPSFEGVDPAALCFLMALCDQATPVWLGGDHDQSALLRYLAFHTGAPLAKRPVDAAFALIAEPAQLPPLVTFSAGEQEYPERSTTVLIQLPSLTAGPPVHIEGPGIQGKATVRPAGLDPAFWPAFAANRDLYPCGVDVILTSGSELLALPRSVIVEI